MDTQNLRKKRMTLAFNGDLQLIPRLAAYRDVESIFGKLTQDILGGGRASMYLANIDFGRIKETITEAHRHGIKFIYLLNSICQSNRELTRDYNTRLTRFMEKIVNAGTDEVVVAAPYMLRLTKENFPHVKVIISTFCLINAVSKARKWEDLGADRIMLGSDINRNFRVIRKIRQAVKCEIEIFANNVCQRYCPYSVPHVCSMAHSSSSEDKSKGFVMDYHSCLCARTRLTNPAEFISMGFIRPEDIQTYIDLGIDVFKVAGRTRSSDWLLRTVKAYSEEKFDGNLADLIVYPYIMSKDEGLLANAEQWILRPRHVNLRVLSIFRQMEKRNGIVYIDNRKLDGFLDYFKNHDCEGSICDVDCKYCSTVAKKAITFDQEKLARHIEDLETLIRMFEDRSAFRKNPLGVQIGASIWRLLAPRKTNFRQHGPKEEMSDRLLKVLFNDTMDRRESQNKESLNP
ncbi:MAG: peptidase U32 family protein [bacterium]